MLHCLSGGNANAKKKQQEEYAVIKHSAAIHIQNNLTLLQRKAWNVLLFHAYNDLPSKDIYKITVQRLKQLLDYNSKDDEYLKVIIRAMRQCGLEWNVLDKDGANEWGTSTLLASAIIKNGICEYAYSPHLRERLYNPSMYARISLSLQNQFESKHAQALWELCIDYLGSRREYGETPFISVEQFSKLMGTEET